MKNNIILLTIAFLIVSFTGCTPKEVKVEEVKKSIVHTYSIEDTFVELAEGLSENLNKKKIDSSDVAVTTFVQLNNFSRTSKFGRLLSESLYHELSYRKVNMLDFRAKKALSIDASGEYYLSRNVKKLNKAISTNYILVGTYSMYSNNVLINARIINSANGEVVSSAGVIYHDYDCRLFDDCKKSNQPIQLVSSFSKTK